MSLKPVIFVLAVLAVIVLFFSSQRNEVVVAKSTIVSAVRS